MRYRLIELIKEGGLLIPNGAEKIADHLFANGVIVPPVKVGQTVYGIIKGKIVERKIEKIEISEAGAFFAWNWRGMGYEWICEKDIGKTVFLTREQAEKELNDG